MQLSMYRFTKPLLFRIPKFNISVFPSNRKHGQLGMIRHCTNSRRHPLEKLASMNFHEWPVIKKTDIPKNHKIGRIYGTLHPVHQCNRQLISRSVSMYNTVQWTKSLSFEVKCWTWRFFDNSPNLYTLNIQKLIIRSFTVISMEVFVSKLFWSCTSKAIQLMKWKG